MASQVLRQRADTYGFLPLCALPVPTQLPAKSLYEYRFDTSDGLWKAWKTFVVPYQPPLDGQFSRILVPTVDVMR